MTLVEETLEKRFTEEMPERLIGDRAYDSVPLDERLQQQGIEMIAPHKSNRKKPATQDGRPLRTLRCRPLSDTWREKTGVSPVGMATILAYLSAPPGAQLELPALAEMTL